MRLKRHPTRRMVVRTLVSLLAALLVVALPLLHSRHVSAQTVPKRYLVLIVLDGARPGYLYEPNLPHIQALLRDGTFYNNAWAGILESETPSGHAAIATGSEPRKNGVLGFSWANTDNIPTNLFSPTKIRNGAMERIMQASGAPTIASLVHLHHPHAAVVAVGGYKYYAVDALGGPNADSIGYIALHTDKSQSPAFIPGHPLPPAVVADPALTVHGATLPFGTQNHLGMVMAADTFAQTHARVTLINEPEFDWPLGHVYGANRNQHAIQALMTQFDTDLGMLEAAYKAAHVLKKTIFVITADHGFAPTFHVVQSTVIEKAVLAAGTSIVSSAYHTAGFLWLRDASKARVAAQNVADLKNPYIQSVYYRDPIAGGFVYHRVSKGFPLRVSAVDAANRYLLNSFNGPDSPTLAIFFRENAGATIPAQASWKADHGGGSWESQHLPLLISGPGVRKGYTSTFPARLIDIAPTALTLMHIPPTGMQGILLADAMTHPAPADQTTQTAVGRALSPLVSALQAESSVELQKSH